MAKPFIPHSSQLISESPVKGRFSARKHNSGGQFRFRGGAATCCLRRIPAVSTGHGKAT